MARSQETYNKKEIKKKKDKKKKDKLARKLAKGDGTKSSLDDMIAYVDENGVISSTPPDPSKRTVILAEDIEVSIKKQEDIIYDPIRKGTVTFFNDAKGYGFIKDSETKESIFVHANNVIDELKENNMVTFEVEMGQKGPTAVKVKLDKK